MVLPEVLAVCSCSEALHPNISTRLLKRLSNRSMQQTLLCAGLSVWNVVFLESFAAKT